MSLDDWLLTGVLYKISSLGLNKKSVSLQDLLDPDSGVEDAKIVWQWQSSSPIKLCLVMADTQCHPDDVIVNAETGFYVVAPTKSVMFASLPLEGRLIGFNFITTDDFLSAQHQMRLWWSLLFFVVLHSLLSIQEHYTIGHQKLLPIPVTIAGMFTYVNPCLFLMGFIIWVAHT
jgi:hypothetical protein